MRAIEFIPEARRNPDVNKKLPRGQEALQYLASLDSETRNRSFVHMGNINKIGITPNYTNYMRDTEPAGIYCYSAKEYLNKKGHVPYAKERIYVHVITVANPKIATDTANIPDAPLQKNNKQAPQKIRKQLVDAGYNIAKTDNVPGEYAILTTSAIQHVETFILNHFQNQDIDSHNDFDGSIYAKSQSRERSQWVFWLVEKLPFPMSKADEYRLAVVSPSKYKKYLDYHNIESSLSSAELKNATRKYNADQSRVYDDGSDDTTWLGDEIAAAKLLNYASTTKKKLNPTQEKIVLNSGYAEAYKKLLGTLQPPSVAKKSDSVSPQELQYINSINNGRITLSKIPEEFRTESVCLAAVRKNGLDVRYVPEKLITKQICDAAINNRISAIQFVPEKIYTKQFFLDTIKRNPMAIKFVPPYLESEEFYIDALALADHVASLFDIPAKFRTEKAILARQKRMQSRK